MQLYSYIFINPFAGWNSYFRSQRKPSTHTGILLLLLASNANFRMALAAPILEPHNPQEVAHWVSAPATRGTFGLLVSCLLTLSLCLWSSLHLNIPHRDDTQMILGMRKLWWTLVALFAPELIVLMAWYQYILAEALINQVNDALRLNVAVLMSALS